MGFWVGAHYQMNINGHGVACPQKGGGETTPPPPQKKGAFYHILFSPLKIKSLTLLSLY